MTIVSAGNKEYKTISFGPVFISPEFHRKGLGKELITHSIEIAKQMGYRAILTLGYPYHYFIDSINYCIKNNIKVISTSVGPYFINESVNKAIRNAVDHDIIFCWFAYGEYIENGNYKNANLEYEGILKPSCNWQDNSGPYSLDRFMYHENENKYEKMLWGRSPTSPQIAGLAALIKGADPLISPKDISELLKKNSSSLPSGKYIPDMYKILKKVSFNKTQKEAILFNKYDNIQSNKNWKITFSCCIDKSSVNQDSIYVLDENERIVPIVLKISDDSKSVFVKPVNDYSNHKKYCLYITNIKSTKGVKLSKAVYIRFKIK